VSVPGRLAELGLRLPRPMTPPPGYAFNFELVRRFGDCAYVAGHGPIDGTEYLMQGTVGDDLTVDQGYRAARLAALSMLASLNAVLGDLERVTGWIRAVGYVNAVPGFPRTTQVVNGFSDLIVELWGDAGRHARAAPGVTALPFNVPIVVEAIVEVPR
jgi:enamine deaminase RidA (YjgF/YER057c/UK114 family)